MKYHYRCICGFSIEHEVVRGEQVPEALDWDEHPVGEPSTSRVLCSGALKRVWEPPMMNLGYREAHHTQNERHLFNYVG